MKKNLWMLSIPVLLAGCLSRENTEKLKEAVKEIEKAQALAREYLYIDSRDTLQLNAALLSADNLEELTSVKFLKPDQPGLSYSGSYRDGLKNGQWMYIRGLNNIVSINWASFIIGNYRIRTNLSSKGTVTKVDDHTNRYTLVTTDSITIDFYADTLNARVKRMPYEDVIANQMTEKGYTLKSNSNKLLQDSVNIVSVTSMRFTNGTGKTVLYKTAYAVLQSGYIAFAIRYPEDLRNQAELLFDGVLTNIYLDKERVYYPFLKISNSVINEIIAEPDTTTLNSPE